VNVGELWPGIDQLDEVSESASRPPCGFWGIDDQQLET
jgi:hypothetical protein